MNLITEAGLALYGPLWQSQMARDTGHSVRTVQRWAAGDHEPRAKVYALLTEIAAGRVMELGSLLQRLQK